MTPDHDTHCVQAATWSFFSVCVVRQVKKNHGHQYRQLCVSVEIKVGFIVGSRFLESHHAADMMMIVHLMLSDQCYVVSLCVSC